MTVKGKQVLTSVGLGPEEHAFIVEMAKSRGSISAVVREAVRLLMRRSSENLTSEKSADRAAD